MELSRLSVSFPINICWIHQELPNPPRHFLQRLRLSGWCRINEWINTIFRTYRIYGSSRVNRWLLCVSGGSLGGENLFLAVRLPDLVDHPRWICRGYEHKSFETQSFLQVERNSAEILFYDNDVTAGLSIMKF